MTMISISIHALREESDSYKPQTLVVIDISIHALREESDGETQKLVYVDTGISIHALREESDYGFI